MFVPGKDYRRHMSLISDWHHKSNIRLNPMMPSLNAAVHKPALAESHLLPGK